MKLSQLASALDVFFEMPKPRVPLIQSAPGLGKSTVVAQEAAKRGFRLITWRLGQMDAVEVGGLPQITNGRMSYALPDTLPGPNDEPTVVFLDEIADADRMVYNAAAEFILDGTLRGAHTYRLAPQHRIFAASNRLTDRAGARDLPSHIRNRVIFLDVEADFEDWKAWAIDSEIRPEVISFLSRRSELLHKFDPKDRSFPTPRSWEFVSEMLPFIIKKPELQMEMISGAVGEGPATEFTGYLQILHKVPDEHEVLKNPMTAPVPVEDPAIMYALCLNLALAVTEKTRDNFFIYLSRIPQDFAVMTVKDAQRKFPQVLRSEQGVKWTVANAAFLA